MSNQTLLENLRVIQQKFNDFQSRIVLIKSLSDNISVEFEALKHDFEVIKCSIEGTNDKNELNPHSAEGTNDFFLPSRHYIESTSNLNLPSTHSNEGTDNYFSSSSHSTEGMNDSFEGSNKNLGEENNSFEGSNGSIEGTKSPSVPSMAKEELSKLISRQAKEKLKMKFYFPNIPDRMADILLFLKEKKKLRLIEITKLTGASDKSVERAMRTFRQLGWTKFNGSRRNGYYSLTEEGEKVWGYV